MMSLAYWLLLIYLQFPMVATGITRRARHFDVASGPFKCHFSALMWLRGTLKNPLGLKKQTTTTTKKVD